MNKSPENFVECIHKVSYEEEYLTKPITSEQMVYDAGREKESLNGFWNFGIDQYDTCLRAKWYEENYKDSVGRHLPVDYSFDEWEKIKVPSCWNMYRERYFLYEGSAIYTRRFVYINRGEERVFIKFGGVNYEAKIFLNKKYLGFHKGGSTPFYVEVTEHLQEENRLLVVANNTRKRTCVPCENTDWFNYGGLYRDVELIRLPATFIKNVSVALVPGSGYKKIQVNVAAEGPEKNGQALLSIPELKIRQEIKVEDGKGSITLDTEPELWSPENPKLYEVSVSYLKDVINEKVGFREIKVVGTDVFLNGQNIYLKGICLHEDSEDNGRAVSDEQIRESIRIAKEMNCNYLRLAHYPHTGRFAEIADEMGIMLWEEIPVYWAIEFGSEETYQDAENQLSELIKRDINRASVIIWSVGNENADTEDRLRFMSSLAKKAKELDPFRLVSAACLTDHVRHEIKDRLADYLDIIGINEYFGWYDPDFGKLIKLFDNSKPQKPVIITEFGGDGSVGARGTVNDLGTEDCQLEIYKKQVSVIGTIPYVKGTSPWLLFDFRCPRRIHVLQNYYNIKGMLSADRKYRKPAFYVMQKFYSER